MPLIVDLVEAPTDDVVALVGELEVELSGDYAAHQRHGYSIARIFQPNVLFFVAQFDGQAVGCGGIAFEDGFAEVKRMYVRPQNRGKGVGQSILERLEEEARSQRVNRLMLETGDVLYPAIRLYERAGFTRCGAFGGYAAMPAAAVERSVFMEKRIGFDAGSLVDDAFVREFEARRWPLDQWHHRDHVKLAYLYLRRYPFDEAMARIRVGIKAHNAVHGVPESPTRGYHETMTRAWLHLVDIVMREYGAAENANAFVDQHPELSEKKTLRLFYSRERFMSAEAKSSFVEPDLAPLPRSRRAGI